MVLDLPFEGQAEGCPAGLGSLTAFLRRRLFNCDQPSRKPLDNQEANHTVNVIISNRDQLTTCTLSHMSQYVQQTSSHKTQTMYHQVANHLISTLDENESRSKQTIQNTGYLVTPSSECYLVIAVATIWQVVRLSVPQKTNSLASLVHSSRENNFSSIHFLSFTSFSLCNYITQLFLNETLSVSPILAK